VRFVHGADNTASVSVYLRKLGSTEIDAILFEGVAPGTGTSTILLPDEGWAYEFAVFFSGFDPLVDPPYAVSSPWETGLAETVTTIGFGGIPDDPTAFAPFVTWTSRPFAVFPDTQPYVQAFNACSDYGSMNLAFGFDPYVFSLVGASFSPFGATPNLASPLQVMDLNGTTALKSYDLDQALLETMQGQESLFVFREDSSEDDDCVLQVYRWQPTGEAPIVTPFIYPNP
jgi:hypothetical protein